MKPAFPRAKHNCARTGAERSCEDSCGRGGLNFVVTNSFVSSVGNE